MFKATGISQNATYNAIIKELRLEAGSFSGQGEAAKILQTSSEVDLKAFEPQLLVYPEDEPTRRRTRK